jgi:hypothetical protein
MLKYSDLISDKEFKTIVHFISKKWSSHFDNSTSIAIDDRNIEIHSFKKALQNYHWPYKIKESLPNGYDYCGSSFQSSSAILELASEKLKSKKDFKNGAAIVLEWGGVISKNLERIQELTFSEFNLEIENARLNWEGFCNNEIEPGLRKIDFHINSGFSKIYSLLLNDFIIYDSRTAAALTAIIFEVLSKTPENWTLKVPSPRVDFEKRILTEFGKVNTKKQYWESNIIANTIVKEVCVKLNSKGESVSMRQLEAALFMLGADIRKLKGINKKK